jgi:hypothetical protein
MIMTENNKNESNKKSNIDKFKWEKGDLVRIDPEKKDDSKNKKNDLVNENH